MGFTLHRIGVILFVGSQRIDGINWDSESNLSLIS